MADADALAETDRGQHGRLGEDLGVRPDAHLEVLRPQARRDELPLEGHGSLAARTDGAKVAADGIAEAAAKGVHASLVAARALLDDTLHEALGKGHAAGADDLQVERAEQGQAAGRAPVGVAAGHDVVEVGDATQVPGTQQLDEIGSLEQVADRRTVRQQVVHAVGTDGHRGRPTDTARAAVGGQVDASQQGTAQGSVGSAPPGQLVGEGRCGYRS